jgi:hypothetical protein
MDTHNVPLILLSSQREAPVLHIEHIMAQFLSHILGELANNSDGLGTASMLQLFLKLNIHPVGH